MDNKDNQQSNYLYYISILEKHGIFDARIQMENMLVLDYIMLKIKVAPIYDTGQSLLSQSDYFAMNFDKGNGKFFTNTQTPFDRIIKNVETMSRFDFSKLDSVMERWKKELIEWTADKQISIERIDRITEGVKTRIKKISDIQTSSERQHLTKERGR